ncbi:OPT family oligopeptide transporter [candidate division KSB1 bacterium]
MEIKQHEPYVPEQTDMKEFTFKAIFIGVILSMVLGAANAYIGLRAGMTVAATFPAAVIAMAFLRIFKGNILEENIARATATVGEALVAGAIFVVPAFIITGVWSELKYFETTMMLLIGGILGVLFIIILRRSLIAPEANLQFPESLACAQIVLSGQKGASGAKWVFITTGISAFVELIKNSHGIQFIQEYTAVYIQPFKETTIEVVDKVITHKGAFFFSTPSASPAYMGVGYIIGPRLASITFSGGVFGWLLLIPILVFAQYESLSKLFDFGNPEAALELGDQIWMKYVRPIAVGGMLVGAVNTLYNIRKNLIRGISKTVEDMKTIKAGLGGQISRYEQDINFNGVIVSIAVLSIPVGILYYYFCNDLMAAVIAAVAMIAIGFLFAAVAGYLVGLIGSSSNPISGLALTSLVIAAVLMVALGVKGPSGIAAVLGVVSVVACTAGIAGDVIQDLKVGHILGGTPRKMQWAGMLGVIAAALVMYFPLVALHQAYGGFGSPDLPAPQAGLMAMMAEGIVTQNMAWPLVIGGMFFAVGLIMIKSPSPMLIAVGMYLPLHTTFAIFVGGIFKFIIDKIVARKKMSQDDQDSVSNRGLLIASGFVAGESLVGIIIAFLIVGTNQPDFTILNITFLSGTAKLILGFIAIPILGFIMVKFPLNVLKEKFSK